MKKNYIIFFSLITMIGLFIFLTNDLKAIEINDPTDVISVTKSGETEHGNYELSLDNTNFEGEEFASGYIGGILVYTDPGYYVKNITVTFGDDELRLGEATGQGFFRHWDYSPFKNDYQFVIPVDASSSNKVNVAIEYASKAPVTITYRNYDGDKYDERDLIEFDSYNNTIHNLVVDYMDGDIVLSEDCMVNGCLLEFQFDSEDDYNEYKNYSINEFEDWFGAGAVYRDPKTNEDRRVMFTEDEFCDDENLKCYVVVSKEFGKVSYGWIYMGYSKINVFAPGSYNFDVHVDVENFSDILAETGSSVISINANNLERNIELFYGTKSLYFEKKEAMPIINDEQENNCGSLGEMDDVIGEGYGYEFEYGGDIATAHINSYYQDKMVLEFDIMNNGEPVFDEPVRINLDRFAFSGNGGELLEVDVYGRNCREDNNNNTCDEGIYYSTEYRGVLSSFYVDENPEAQYIDAYRISSINGSTVNVEEDDNRMVFERNQNFTPHAIALFYDVDDMVVLTKDIDINSKTEIEGFVDRNTFSNLYNDFTIVPGLTRDYVFMDVNYVTAVSNITYFDNHLDGTIMYPLVLISKDEAKELGIKKIALFLVNGEIEDGSLPALTYGTGEGKVMEIRGED